MTVRSHTSAVGIVGAGPNAAGDVKDAIAQSIEGRMILRCERSRPCWAAFLGELASDNLRTLCRLRGAERYHQAEASGASPCVTSCGLRRFAASGAKRMRSPAFPVSLGAVAR